MRSSERALATGAFAGALVVATAVASNAAAQQPAQGFAVDRFYESAPGGGWFVMDDLDLHGGLGGVASMTTGYAMKPLRVTDGVQHVAVVSDEAITDLGFAATYDRWRVYLNLDAPLLIQGQCGSGAPCTVGSYQLTSPSLDLASHPDTFSDARIGVDVRILGDARSPFRLGAGAQIFIPEGDRADYDTDGTVRAMVRALAAGDRGALTYAAQLGVHIRPLDDSPAPGSPQGSELLFGVAAGVRLPVSRDGAALVVVGPEVYGETAFRSFFGTTATGLEGLLSGRLEQLPVHGPKWRVKLGGGGGLDPHFGAPEWRLVVGVELFDHNAL
ncbi:MAG: hypothetical protein ABSE49_27825 [Polyangiaceae bacterium]|jgi:hypothetical protein